MPANYQGDATARSPEHATAVYRIDQEALRNVDKHAGITYVKVLLDVHEGGTRLQIRDLAIGFGQDDEHSMRGLRLVSLKERSHIAGGPLSVKSKLTKGKIVVFSLPEINNHG